MKKIPLLIAVAFAGFVPLSGCNNGGQPGKAIVEPVHSDTPEYYLLRPEVEKLYGYSHAVKIGGDIKI